MDAHHDPFDGDEEAALRYAIALSLQDPDTPTPPLTTKNPIELDSDGSEDDDLENGPKCPPTPKKVAQSANIDIPKATSVSATLAALAASATSAASRSLPKLPTASPSAQSSVFVTLGLDRKRMEEERLARATKRKAPHDDEPARRQPQRTRIDSQPDSTPLATATPTSTSAAFAPLPYPKGTVKKTWVSGYQRGDDIKIEEIFLKEQLQLAVLSSFQWDEQWLLSKIDIQQTKMVCIAFASNEHQKEEMRANVPRDRIRFCFPPMMPAGSMHSKLQLLKFPNFLRIVIPTGNLVPYDWGETGVMENMVFLIDLPITKIPTDQLTMFGQELCYFLNACGLDQSLVHSLSRYDFSETSNYRFIHTIGQSHLGEEWRRTGYCGLGRAVQSLGLATTSEVELDFVVASLGSVNNGLILAIYNAAQGDDGLREYEKRTASGGKKSNQNTGLGHHSSNFRIYFPSHETVSQSRGGKNCGGTICLQGKWWDSPTFPRGLVHDCRSVRPGLLMHTKILFVRHPHHEKLQPSWAYLGSANLSESAWGRLVKDRVSGKPKLNCRNWECGVLIPMNGETAKLGLGAFEERIPVPMVVPGEAYGKTGSKRPWLFLEA
ncbi:putative ubiquitin interaction domain-containing protein [Rosellinia necatrix]|uniref:Putative ubiquitin interaction domain-containing protein n=1 Tax=Rosellinia necatrix TaxID=77044 RepID=A0A1W2THW1_ROSNE|nr:putative ubiquitin interaction domain-containing protein [Rosellinia necatrix]